MNGLPTPDDIRRNNFDLLRLVLASIVMLFHIGALSQENELAFVQRYFNGKYAVMGFFAISGFLITMSFQRSRTLQIYSLKRIRRIVPGYVTVVVLMTLIGLVFSEYTPGEFLRAPATWKYLTANLTYLNFLQPDLPGLFQTNPYNSAVNGSLWSIRTELFCYALVPGLFWLCQRLSPQLACVVTYAALAGIGIILDHLSQARNSALCSMLKLGITDQCMCFLTGVLVYFRYHDFVRSRTLWITAAMTTWVVTHWLPTNLAGESMQTLLRPGSLSLVVLAAGLFTPHLGNVVRYGDFSYGIYIYHYPIVQLLVAYGFFEQPALAVFLTLVLTTMCACGSWHIIEKRFLRRDSHYIRPA